MSEEATVKKLSRETRASIKVAKTNSYGCAPLHLAYSSERECVYMVSENPPRIAQYSVRDNVIEKRIGGSIQYTDAWPPQQQQEEEGGEAEEWRNGLFRIVQLCVCDPTGELFLLGHTATVLRCSVIVLDLDTLDTLRNFKLLATGREGVIVNPSMAVDPVSDRIAFLTGDYTGSKSNYGIYTVDRRMPVQAQCIFSTKVEIYPERRYGWECIQSSIHNVNCGWAVVSCNGMVVTIHDRDGHFLRMLHVSLHEGYVIEHAYSIGSHLVVQRVVYGYKVYNQCLSYINLDTMDSYEAGRFYDKETYHPGSMSLAGDSKRLAYITNGGEYNKDGMHLVVQSFQDRPRNQDSGDDNPMWRCANRRPGKNGTVAVRISDGRLVLEARKMIAAERRKERELRKRKREREENE